MAVCIQNFTWWAVKSFAHSWDSKHISALAGWTPLFCTFQCVLCTRGGRTVLLRQSVQSESWAGQKMLDNYLGEGQLLRCFVFYNFHTINTYKNLYIWIWIGYFSGLVDPGIDIQRGLFSCSYWLLIVITIGKRGGTHALT